MERDAGQIRLVILTGRLHSPSLQRLINILDLAPVQLAGIMCARNPRDSILHHWAANSRMLRSVLRGTSATDLSSPVAEGRGHAIRRVHHTFDAPQSVERLRRLSPDLLLHVHGPIFRSPTFEAARLGLLNCHMGYLPRFRGMNALEWSVLNGYPTGNTVHFVDSGIDTGKIVAFFPVPIDECRSLAQARMKLAHESAPHLARAISMIARDDTAPYPQEEGAGRQHYRMHPVLRRRVEGLIASGYRPQVAIDEIV